MSSTDIPIRPDFSSPHRDPPSPRDVDPATPVLSDDPAKHRPPRPSPVDYGADDLPTYSVTVTDDMVEEARERAEKYDDWAPIKDCDPVLIHMDGMIGEVAVGQHYGVSRDDDIYDSGGDGGIDIVLHDGTMLHKLNVKTRRYYLPYLLVPHWEDIVANHYVLCDLPGVPADAGVEDLRGREVDVRLWGFATEQQIAATRVSYDGPRGDIADRLIHPRDMAVIQSREVARQYIDGREIYERLQDDGNE